LWDIEEGDFRIENLPKPPEGRRIARVDLTIHLKKGSEK
jgi:hypothetical protein